MASNPYVNKVVKADGTVLIDISGDTVTAGSLLSGVTAHDGSGAPVIGTMFQVGSLYATAAKVNPASILGIGTWQLIRESRMTWGEMAGHTWGEVRQDTWGHVIFCPEIYVWKRMA